VGVDVRLLVVGTLVLFAVCLGIAFTRNALAIRRHHHAQFRRIRRQLEDSGMSLIAILLRRRQ
jgi:hypothetical protein